MNIKIISHHNQGIERQLIEMVERKGIGHPDTLSDLIADTFSNIYSLAWTSQNPRGFDLCPTK
jgi:S-adenosylmethionine synthetase